MRLLMLLVIAAIILTSCTENEQHREEEPNPIADVTTPNPPVKRLINKDGNTIETRLLLPDNFQRVEVEKGSFEEFLRVLPLKPDGARVHYYNGGIKGRDVYEAVVDMDVGERDLQQCADAIIRLRGEYLFNNGQFEEIHFNFTNGFPVHYTKWMNGYRVSVEGNKCYWVKGGEFSNTYEDFRKYLDIVFAYAGTLSLENELKSVSKENLSIGDVIIQGGSPGHGVIVVDMAENIETGERIFLLAQSYMPAQEIHILKNPMSEELSPWYSADFKEILKTPEWTFTGDDIKGFD